MLTAGAAARSLQRLWNCQELTFEADSARVARRHNPPPVKVVMVTPEEPPTVQKVVPSNPPKAKMPSQRPSIGLPLVATTTSALVALPRRGAIQKHTIRREESLLTLAERRRERGLFSSAIAEACAAYRNHP
jgi:hypothetical protein